MIDYDSNTQTSSSSPLLNGANDRLVYEDENCSCSSCECTADNHDEYDDGQIDIRPLSSCTSQPMKMTTFTVDEAPTNLACRSTRQSHEHSRLSMNNNRPAIGTSDDASAKDKSSGNRLIRCCNESAKNQEINDRIASTIYEIIDQSYAKISLLYKLIERIKLDSDFILSASDYLDRLKINVYKDLIRRETLLRNGKNHARNLVALLRCMCKVSYEQALESSTDWVASKRAVLYTMKAVEYLLQRNFPQKKPLFNYILNEYIVMWLHENLRTMQEDLSVIAENTTDDKFFSLCNCLFHKLESTCAINWERLQMIQNYRLSYFNQLMKPISVTLETNREFAAQFGKPWSSTMKLTDLPVTQLYASRTENELTNIREIQHVFCECIARCIRPDVLLSVGLVNSHQDINFENEEKFRLIDQDQLTKQSDDSVQRGITHREEDDTTITPQVDLSSSVYEQLNALSSSPNPREESTSGVIPEILTQLVDAEPLPSKVAWDSTDPPSSTLSISQHNTTENFPVTTTDLATNSELMLETQLTNHPPMAPNFILPSKSSQDEFIPQSPMQNASTLPNRIMVEDSKNTLNIEFNALMEVLTKFMKQQPIADIENGKETRPFVEQLQHCLMTNGVDSNLIGEPTQHHHPQISLNVSNPLFFSAFTHALRKELEDAQILSAIDRGQFNQQSHTIGHLPFETINALKLPNADTVRAGNNIDQSRVFVEVTHDPSKCTPNPDFSHSGCPPCMEKQQHEMVDSISNRHSPSKHEHQHGQRWYWIRQNEFPPCKDCVKTGDSLFCSRQSLDRHTHSITVEHSDHFR